MNLGQRLMCLRPGISLRAGHHFVPSNTSEPSSSLPAVALPAVLACVTDEAPSSLLEVVTAAVDPFEIAASLETCGFSNAVVRKRFGQRDVFALAEQLFAAAKFRPAPADNPRTKHPGSARDLGRGIVFAAPTLMFAGAAIALHSWLPLWTVPLSLICGWAFSQFVSYVGHARAAADSPVGSAVIWALLSALFFTALLGFGCHELFGGSCCGIVFALAACAFMTTAAELVVQGGECLIALILVPGAIGSLVFITHEPFSLPVVVAVGLAGTSIGGTVLAALWRVPASWWRDFPVTRADFPVLVHYFANGCCCGCLVALFMVLEPAKSGALNWPGAAAYPMVLSLGVMEWQLRSLSAGIRHALLDSYSLPRFVKAARRKLARSTVLYLGALAFLTGSIDGIAQLRGVPLPAALLAAASCLALAFFLALVVASCGRIDLVLQAWLGGLGIYGALAFTARYLGPGWAFHNAELAFCAAISGAAIALVFAARRVVLNPVYHG
jgi:hypothetical protein